MRRIAFCGVYRLPGLCALLLVAGMMGVPAATGAEPPGEAATEAAMQVIRNLHRETEEQYREVAGLSYDEQETALNIYAEQQMRKYLDLERILPRVYDAHWTEVESRNLQADAEKAALVLMRKNIRAAFDNYQRKSRLQLLRIQTDANSRDQIWISGTVGAPTGRGGSLPFTFIAKIHERAGEWLGVDLNFLGASLVEFARSDMETHVASQGLEAVIAEYAAQAVTDP